ncbi:MAG: VCBS repeat-containing protein [Deltaproteobacteria bacterium]|nr:VCBS repeat-containing protein [Deltaproteobacteria bacterium]
MKVGPWAASGGLLLALACGRNFSAPTESPLSLTSTRLSVAPLGVARLDAQGGTPPFRFAFADGGDGSAGSVTDDGSFAVYQAGDGGNAVDVLEVNDATGAKAQVRIAVGANLTLSPPSVALAPGQSLSFVATGGEPPYAFDLTGCSAPCDGGGSCVSATGSYRAGTTCDGAGVDTVTARDKNGAQAVAEVLRSGNLAVEPANARVVPGGSISFQVQGGQPPYTFSLAPHGNESGAAQPSQVGLYVAGPNPDGVDRVRVTDQAGSSVDAVVQVSDRAVPLPATSTVSLVRGDFNGDGVDDVAALSTDPNGRSSVAVALGGPSGFALAPTVHLATGVCGGAHSGDLDGDGVGDLVLPLRDADGAGCHTFQIYFGSPTGALTLGPALQVPAALPGDLNAVPVAIPGAGPVLAVAYLDAQGQAQVPLFRVAGAGPYATDFGGEALEQLGALGPYALAQDGGLQGASSSVRLDSAPVGGPGLVLGLVTDASTPSTHLAELQPLWLERLGGAPDGGVAAGIELRGRAFADEFPPVGFGQADFDGDGEPDVWIIESAITLSVSPSMEVWLRLPDAGAGPFISTALTAVTDLSSQGAVARPATMAPVRWELDALGIPEGLQLQSGSFQGVTPLSSGLRALSGGDFDGDQLPDLAAVDLAFELQLQAGNAAGQLSLGHVEDLTPTTATELMVGAALEVDGGFDAVVAEEILAGATGVELRLMAGQPDGNLSTDVHDVLPALRVLALSPGPQGRVWAELLVPPQGHVTVAPLDLGTDGGLAGAVDVFDGVVSEGLDEMVGGGAQTGHDLVATASLPFEGLAALPLLLAPDGGLARGTPSVFAGASWAVPTEQGGFSALVVATRASQDITLTLQPPQAGADGTLSGWDSTPSGGPVSLLGLLGGSQVWLRGMVPLALEVGGPRNRVAVLAKTGDDPRLCAQGGVQASLFVFAAGDTLGAAPEATLALPNACTPDESQWIEDDFASGLARGELVAADADGDGHTDLLLAGGDLGDVAIYYGDGLGGFDGPHLVPVGGKVRAVSVGDVNGDGQPDLVILRSDLSQLRVLLGAPGRIFR